MSRAVTMHNLKPGRNAMTLIETLVVISVMALMVALLLPGLQAAREAARRVHCASNVSQVSKAVQVYASNHSMFPPRVISWTSISNGEQHVEHEAYYSMFARVLPELEQSTLFDSINFHASIDESHAGNQGPHLYHARANDTVRATYLSVLICPSDTQPRSRSFAPTNIRVNGGSLPWIHWIYPELYRFDGPASKVSLGLNRLDLSRGSSTIASVTDGLSQTVLLSEKLRGHETIDKFDPRRHLAKLLDAPASTITSDEMRSKCRDPNESIDGFISRAGLVWMIGTSTNSVYNHVSGVNSSSSDCIYATGSDSLSDVSARSQHPGGVNAGFADGSVRFVRNGISLQVWRALGTKGAGETISSDEY